VFLHWWVVIALVDGLLVVCAAVMVMGLPPLSPSKLKISSVMNKTLVSDQLLAGSVNYPGLPFALVRLVTAQSQHESANYTSDVFLQTNNCFGYKYYAKSPYQNGYYNGYAKYATVEDSVQEIVDYLYRRVQTGEFPDLGTITTAEQYATLLKNLKYPGPYFGAPLKEYIDGINSYL
jgi:Mannosyl-glycoprotein endo-beta-N-acetylglucosaminidase